MKSYIQYFFFSTIVFLLLTACGKDFLNSSIRNMVVREEYVTDLQGCSEMLNGLYLNLSNAYANYNTIYPEIIADNIRPVTGQTALSAFYNWVQISNETDEQNIGSSSQNLNGYSYAYYKIISTCNYLMEKTTEFQQKDISKAHQIQGQVLAIRALSYFQLVNAFAQSYNYSPNGDHPGVVFTLSTDWAVPANGRSTVAYIYQMIITDLNNAIILLAPERQNTFFFNQQSAKALLSRIYLFKQDYQQASVLATQITQTVPLTTVDGGYPNDLFKIQPPAKTEVLLQLLPGSSIALGHSGGGLFAGQYFRSNKQFVATNDIGMLLTGNVTDVRKSWVTNTGNVWNITKFPSGLIPDVSPIDASYLQPVIRSSEIFLIAAEALMKLNKEDSARFYLNAIRKRAKIDTLGVSIGGVELLDSIYTERRKELAFEGFRMYDLMRWKKGVYRKDAASPSIQSLPYPSNFAIGPLPLQDVRAAGLKQNPGY